MAAIFHEIFFCDVLKSKAHISLYSIVNVPRTENLDFVCSAGSNPGKLYDNEDLQRPTVLDVIQFVHAIVFAIHLPRSSLGLWNSGTT